jgi:hypothetical protein
MNPDQFVFRDHLQRTSIGKVDCQVLPSRELTCADSCGGGPLGARAPRVAGLTAFAKAAGSPPKLQRRRKPRRHVRGAPSQVSAGVSQLRCAEGR